MTHITVTSETRLTSTNGDGPAVLENAATLYAALSALGAVPIVEIVIRTQPEGTYTTPARVVEHVADSGAYLTAAGAPPFGRASRLAESDKLLAELNPAAPNPTTPPLREAGAGGEPDPIPAAPAAPQPAEAGDVLFEMLTCEQTTWRKLSQPERRAAAAHALWLMQAHNHGEDMSQAEYNAHKPAFLPNAISLWTLFDRMPWAEILSKAWHRSLT